MITEDYFIKEWKNVTSLLSVTKMRNFILDNAFNMSSDLYEISLQACNGREKQLRERLLETLTKL
jgi:hypothetical protein